MHICTYAVFHVSISISLSISISVTFLFAPPQVVWIEPSASMLHMIGWRSHPYTIYCSKCERLSRLVTTTISCLASLMIAIVVAVSEEKNKTLMSRFYSSSLLLQPHTFWPCNKLYVYLCAPTSRRPFSTTLLFVRNPQNIHFTPPRNLDAFLALEEYCFGISLTVPKFSSSHNKRNKLFCKVRLHPYPLPWCVWCGEQ